MRVLLVGGGGREHALAVALRASVAEGDLIAAPGNVGMVADGVRCAPVLAHDISGLCELAKAEKIDFAVIGPDQALADGIVDELKKIGVPAFGPSRAAAQIESSKAFAKELMQAAKIPTAEFHIIHSVADAEKMIPALKWDGIVVKADGLALGKGVVVCPDAQQALAIAKDFLSGTLGNAGKTLVLEERLQGPEVSAFYFCDGENFRELGFACDYKQLLDGGKGPNTGGMGAYSPVDWLPAGMSEEIGKTVVTPLLQTMRARGIPFSGMLFVGLMLTKSGPKVLEFNARFGDPETQALLPLLAEPLLPWLQACASGALDQLPKSFRKKNGATVHVVCAADGYPGTEGKSIRKGDNIFVHPQFPQNGKVYFAGVSKFGDKLFSNGGRVLGVTAYAENRDKAREFAYDLVDRYINFEQRHFRRDIGT